MLNELEAWRPVVGYEGYYLVSSFGRVKSLQFRPGGKVVFREKLLSLCPNSKGYIVLILVKDGIHQTVTAHQLVAQAFLPPPPTPEHRFVNHKRGAEKWNNHASNLEWATSSGNAQHASDTGLWPQSAKGELNPQSKLTEVHVRLAKGLLERGYSERKIAKQLSEMLGTPISRSTVTMIKRGITWKHVV